MHKDGSAFMLDAATCFFDTVRLFGWFHRPGDKLKSVEYIEDDVLAVTSRVSLRHDGVATLGSDLGFSVQGLQRHAGLRDRALLRLTTERGWHAEVPVVELCNERVLGAAKTSLFERFVEETNAVRGRKILDLGGRARSGMTVRSRFETKDYTAFDIIADDGVDVVGDAHELAQFFPPQNFDVILSTSVFEHLMMPWAVVIQMNAVLRTGGTAFISTHQTTGMHDMPWDFWRFSDVAWDALFNRATGFEVIGRELGSLVHIIPMIWTSEAIDAEYAAGYRASMVLVRKIGPCRMAWPLRARDVTESMYPGK